MMKERKTCSGVNRVFLLILFQMTVVPLLLGRLLLHVNVYGGTVITVCLYMTPILLYVAVTRGRCLRDIPFAVPRLSVLLLVFLFVVLLQPVVTWINMFSMMFSRNHIAEEMLAMEQQSFWKNVIFTALIPAAAEELAVRGVLYHGYRKAGVLKAAVVSGLLFGIMHLNINQFCYAAVLGIVFALLVEATGNLLYSVEAHFLINLNSVLLLNTEASCLPGVHPPAHAFGERGIALASCLSGAHLPVCVFGERGFTLTAQSFAGQETAQEISASAGSDLIFLWTFYSAMAVVCIILARAVFIWIAKRSHRWDYMQAVFRGEERENRPEIQRYRVITPSLVIAVLAGFVYMILTEWILR